MGRRATENVVGGPYDGGVETSAWQPLKPPRIAAASAFVVTPFSRLARTHAAGTAGDAVVAVALASSMFFKLEPGEARLSIIRYLILTMVPFAIVSPLIGPLIDRLKSGHRYVIIATAGARSVLCLFMVGDIGGQNPYFFFEALGVLAMQKAYQVARNALVPTVVKTDAELVEGNSKLALISGLMGFAGAVPGVALGLIGPEWTVGFAAIVFALTAALATKIPATQVASEPADKAEKVELRGAGIVLAASAMGLLRGIVGFLTLLLAFDFRGDDVPAWQFGAVVAASVLGGLVGAAVAPRLRQVLTEERMLTGALMLTTSAALAAIVVGRVQGAAVLAAAVGVSAAAGKLAFDSIVQRDAPDANRGRSFAKFETRFQLMWVFGAFIAIAPTTLSATTGFIIVAVVGAFAVFSYVVGRLATQHRSGQSTAATARAAAIEERMKAVEGGIGRGARAVTGRVTRRGRRSPAIGPAPDDAPTQPLAPPANRPSTPPPPAPPFPPRP
jgi:MFS family permease